MWYFRAALSRNHLGHVFRVSDAQKKHMGHVFWVSGGQEEHLGHVFRVSVAQKRHLGRVVVGGIGRWGFGDLARDGLAGPVASTWRRWSRGASYSPRNDAQIVSACAARDGSLAVPAFVTPKPTWQVEGAWRAARAKVPRGGHAGHPDVDELSGEGPKTWDQKRGDLVVVVKKMRPALRRSPPPKGPCRARCAAGAPYPA